LAVLFQQGFVSVKPNAALSAQWYSKAIEYSKDRRAQTRLGIAYLEGKGVPQETIKGQEFLLSAAKAGSSEAQYRLVLLDQPDIQAAQSMSVAAMTDEGYGSAVQAAFSRVSGRDQEEIKRRASLWVHAHLLDRQLPAFSEPIGSP
jgi:TPR repeat protein